MPGLTFCNGLISSDKDMNTDFAYFLFIHLYDRSHLDTVQKNITDTIDIKQESFTDALA